MQVRNKPAEHLRLQGHAGSIFAPFDTLLRSQRGAYQVEYVIVLLLVAMAAGLTIGALALPLLEYHQSMQMFIVLPVP